MRIKADETSIAVDVSGEAKHPSGAEQTSICEEKTSTGENKTSIAMDENLLTNLYITSKRTSSENGNVELDKKEGKSGSEKGDIRGRKGSLYSIESPLLLKLSGNRFRGTAKPRRTDLFLFIKTGPNGRSMLPISSKLMGAKNKLLPSMAESVRGSRLREKMPHDRGATMTKFKRDDYHRVFDFAWRVYCKSRNKEIKQEALEIMASAERGGGQLHIPAIVGNKVSDYLLRQSLGIGLPEAHLRLTSQAEKPFFGSPV